MYEQIENLITKDRLKDALTLMYDNLDDYDKKQQVTLTLSRLSGLATSVTQGIVSHNDSKIERNQIRRSIISLLNDFFERDTEVENKKEVTNTSPEPNQPIVVEAINLETVNNMSTTKGRLEAYRRAFKETRDKIAFEREFKKAKELADEFLKKSWQYLGELEVNPHYDMDEVELKSLMKIKDKFIKNWALPIKNRDKRIVAEALVALKALEDDLNKEDLLNIIGDLSMVDVKRASEYKSLEESVNTARNNRSLARIATAVLKMAKSINIQ